MIVNLKVLLSYENYMPNSWKIFGLAFLYVLIGTLILSVFVLIYMGPVSDYVDLFQNYVRFILPICVMWGFEFGYGPTLLGGYILYCVISYRFQTKNLSKVQALFLGATSAGVVSLSVSLFMLWVGFRPADRIVFLPHFSMVCIIATFIGAFAGSHVYEDIRRRFSGGKNG